MTKFSAKTSLLSLTVIVLLAGCGKSKELKTSGAVSPPASPSAPQVVTPPAPNLPDLSSTAPQVNLNPNNDLLPDDGRQPVATDTNDSEQSKKTDESNGSNDGLAAEFKTYGLKVSPEQQKLNKKLAEAIIGARLVSTGSSDMQLDLAIDETVNGTGGLKNYRLKATADGDMLKVSQISANGDLDFQGGFVKCLTVNGDCSTAYAKIKLSGAYTRLIFRRAHTNRHFLTEKNITNNRSFDLLKSYILNSSGDLETNQKIEAVETASFEVINGRSATGVMLTTKDQQMIGLNVPVATAAKQTDLNVPVAISADLSKSYPLPTGASFSQKLAAGISEARLVESTGVGQLKVKLTLGTGSEKGAIWLLTTPIKKDTLSLEKVRQFEAKVKNF